MPAKRQVKTATATPVPKHKAVRKQEKKEQRHSLKFAEPETSTSIPEIDEIDNVRQDLWGGMMEVDLWQERKQSLWEQLLNQ
jgi:hypothetical protein